MTEKIKEALKKLPYLRTVLLWCDENMEDDVEFDVKIAWIAEEFKYDLEKINVDYIKNIGRHVAIESLISGKMENINTRENIKTYTKVGLIKLDKCCFSIKYKDIINPINTTYVVNINNMDYNSRSMTDEQLEKYIDEIDTLFDQDNSKVDSYEKIKAMYTVFHSPRMSDPLSGYTVTQNFVQQKNGTIENVEEFIAACNKDFDKIINLYLSYLWKSNKENKDLKYVYSYTSWFDKNKHMWHDSIEENDESIDLFNDTHQNLLRIFDAIKEPFVRYWKKMK